jgi:hypothetical protein
MTTFECSPRTPWGIHAQVRNDEDCPRCGWTAPGPIGAARADAAEVASVLATALAAEQGWAEIGRAA